MTEQLRSVLIGTAGLDVAAAFALWLTLARPHLVATDPELRTFLRVVVAAICIQAAHFAEELATGFHERFPELLGLSPWPAGFFVSFNLAWIAVWCLSVWGLGARHRLAVFPLWFLGIACVANGLAHPLLAVRAGGYFPGLVTSPVVGIIGILLVRSLLNGTTADLSDADAAAPTPRSSSRAG